MDFEFVDEPAAVGDDEVLAVGAPTRRWDRFFGDDSWRYGLAVAVAVPVVALFGSSMPPSIGTAAPPSSTYTFDLNSSTRPFVPGPSPIATTPATAGSARGDCMYFISVPGSTHPLGVHVDEALPCRPQSFGSSGVVQPGPG